MVQLTYTDWLSRKSKGSQALSDVLDWMGYESDKASNFCALDIWPLSQHFFFGDPFPHSPPMELSICLPVVASRVRRSCQKSLATQSTGLALFANPVPACAASQTKLKLANSETPIQSFAATGCKPGVNAFSKRVHCRKRLRGAFEALVCTEKKRTPFQTRL